MKNKYTPEIRFSGFSIDWDKQKLCEVAEFNPKSKLPKQFEYVDLESVVGINLISHRTENKETAPSRAQRLAQQGDVFFQTVRPYQKNNYLFNLSFDNYVFSTGYAQMRPYIDSYYLLSRVQEDRFISKVLDRCTGTSYPAINSNVLSQIEISIPPLKDEQSLIGNFFKKLDDIISFHQQELTTLKQTKQGFLQKMFPKEGESVPEVRFPGFDGDWERCKFENVLNETDGIRRGPFGSALKKEFFVSESDYVVYEQQNAIYDNYETRYNITKEKFEELKNFKLSEGDFILSGAGTIGRISKVPAGIKQGVFNQALIRFKINSNYTDPDYFVQWIRSENMQKKLTGANPGSAINNLVPMSEVKKWDVVVPSKHEQIIIGEFLKSMDGIIDLHKRELDALKETKKAFLQKMFV